MIKFTLGMANKMQFSCAFITVFLATAFLTGCDHVEVWESNTYYSHNPSEPRKRLETRLRTMYSITCHVQNDTEDSDLFIINGQNVLLLVPSINAEECKTTIPYAICETAPGQNPNDLCKQIK